MRIQRFLVGSVFGIFGILAVAGLAYCCGGYGATKPFKVDGGVQTAIQRDGKLYVMSTQGELIMVESPREIESLGRFGLQGASHFDVAGSKVCISVQNRAYVADLAKKTIVAVHVFEKPIAGIGFLNAERIYVLHDGAVQILDTADAKTVRRLTLPDVKESKPRAWFCHAHGDRLYVAAAGRKSSILVIDWQNDKVVNEIVDLDFRLQEFRCVRIQGDKLIAATVFYSYGIPLPCVTAIDLKTRKQTSLRMPRGDLEGIASMSDGPGDHFCLVSRDGSSKAGSVFEYDAQGKLVGTAQVGTANRVLTMFRGRAVVAGSNTLEFMLLTVKKTIDAE